MKQPQRKTMRLKHYDNSRSGIYFVTICSRGKQSLFWSNKNAQTDVGPAMGTCGSPSWPPQIALSPLGQLVDTAICSIPLHYPHIQVDKYVIMPNHVHLLLHILPEENGQLGNEMFPSWPYPIHGGW